MEKSKTMFKSCSDYKDYYVLDVPKWTKIAYKIQNDTQEATVKKEDKETSNTESK